MMIRDAALAPPASAWPAVRTRWFYPAMALASLMVVFVSFAPRFYLRPAALPPMPARVIAHATMFSAWVLLFAAQTTLVARGSAAAHRRLGVLTACVAAAMVLSGPPMAVALARRGEPVSGDPLAFLFIITLDVLMFAVFVGLAVYHRRRPEIHKRLMLLATIILLPAAVSRWPLAAKNPAPAISEVLLAFLAAAIVNDVLVRRRPHLVNAWGAFAILLSLPIRFVIAQSATWHEIAAWLIRVT